MQDPAGLDFCRRIWYILTLLVLIRIQIQNNPLQGKTPDSVQDIIRRIFHELYFR